MAGVSEGVHIKICGVTSIEDALFCVDLGVSAIGLNFVTGSKRCITTTDRARDLALAIESHARAKGKRVLIVGVVANMSVDAMRALVKDAHLGCLQLHGDEPPDVLAKLLPHAYKAVRIASAEDVALAETFPGDHLLVDAKVITPTAATTTGNAPTGTMSDADRGGTGQTFDWSLVKTLAQKRKLTLAGGLRPDNVARAVREVAPFCVDVASGVESAPGIKDHTLVRAFIEAARSTN